MTTIDFPFGLVAESPAAGFAAGGASGGAAPLALATSEEGRAGAERRLARLLQRVRLRLTTPLGSVPLDRRFGIDTAFLDAPASRATLLRQAVVLALRDEPGVRVRSVRLDVALATGRLGRVPVRVEIEVLSA